MRKRNLVNLILAGSLLAACSANNETLIASHQISTPNNLAAKYGVEHGVRPSTSTEVEGTPNFVPPKFDPKAAHKPKPLVKVKVKEVKPVFEKKQSPSEIDAILSDGRNHTIHVLFDDFLKIRVKRGQGDVRSSIGSGFAAHNDVSGGLTALNNILRNYKIKAIAPMFMSDQQTEESLSAREQKAESKQAGVDFPNLGSWAAITLEETDTQSQKGLVQALQNLPFVRVAELVPDVVPQAVHYYAPPTDPLFPAQSNWQSQEINNDYRSDSNSVRVESWWWNRHSLGAAWTHNKGNGLRVAIVDTSFQTSSNDGVPYNHYLKKNFFKKFWWTDSNSDVEPSSSQPQDLRQHGSTVAHAFASRAYDTLGLCGASPDVDLIPIKADGDWASVAAGVEYAVDNGAKVINVSLGVGPTVSNQNIEAITAIKQAFNYAWLNGVTVVYTAGNQKMNVAYNSTDFTGAICVGGVNKFNEFYQDSNYGTRVDIAAAAEGVTHGSVDASGINYMTRRVNGTSYAAPLVAGAAAIIRAYTSEAGYIRNILIFASDVAYGYNPAFPGLREMSSGYNGTENWAKMRVLNAAAATLIAKYYNPSYPVQYYMPASDDYTRIARADGGFNNEAAFPTNILSNFVSSPTLTVYGETYNNGSRWADSVSVFSNRSIDSYEIQGAPYLKDPLGVTMRGTWSSTSIGVTGLVSQYVFTGI